MYETKIACAEKRALAASLHSSKDLFGLFWPIPIACGNARTGNPNFSNLPGSAFKIRFRIDNYRFHITGGGTRSNQNPALRIIRMSDLHLVLFQFGFLRGAVNRSTAPLAAGNLQSRLCKAVSRIKCVAAKTTGRKLSGKRLHRPGVNRFSAVVGNLPTAQIESLALFRRYFRGTQVISKIRSPRVSYSIFRNCLQPAYRFLEKRCRRHEIAGKTGIKRLDDAVHQPHVMEMRE